MGVATRRPQANTQDLPAQYLRERLQRPGAVRLGRTDAAPGTRCNRRKEPPQAPSTPMGAGRAPRRPQPGRGGAANDVLPYPRFSGSLFKTSCSASWPTENRQAPPAPLRAASGAGHTTVADGSDGVAPVAATPDRRQPTDVNRP